MDMDIARESSLQYSQDAPILDENATKVRLDLILRKRKPFALYDCKEDEDHHREDWPAVQDARCQTSSDTCDQPCANSQAAAGQSEGGALL